MKLNHLVKLPREENSRRKQLSEDFENSVTLYAFQEMRGLASKSRGKRTYNKICTLNLYRDYLKKDQALLIKKVTFFWLLSTYKSYDNILYCISCATALCLKKM